MKLSMKIAIPNQQNYVIVADLLSLSSYLVNYEATKVNFRFIVLNVREIRVKSINFNHDLLLLLLFFWFIPYERRRPSNGHVF